MAYNRPEAKMRAKNSMRGCYPHPVMVTLIYFVLTTVLVSIVTMLVSNPFQLASLYLLEGLYDPTDILRAVFRPGQVFLFLILQIVIALYQGVMSYGYTSYALRMVRWERPGYHNLTDGFSNVGRVLTASILIGVFILLWSLLGIVPALLCTIVGVVTDSTVLLSLGTILLVPGSFVGVCVSYYYRMTYYIMLDNPGMRAGEAVRRSKDLMRGKRWELFVQDISFLLWQMLAGITFGIASVWVTPYMCGTESNFYHNAVYGSFPEVPAPPLMH